MVFVSISEAEKMIRLNNHLKEIRNALKYFDGDKKSEIEVIVPQGIKHVILLAIGDEVESANSEDLNEFLWQKLKGHFQMKEHDVKCELEKLQNVS